MGNGSEPSIRIQPRRRLCGIIQLKLRIETTTGLLIRRPLKSQMTIGGADVWPMTLEMKYKCNGNILDLETPYIPGSSVKGRLRFIAEHSMGLMLLTTDNKIFQHVRNLKAYEQSFPKGKLADAYREMIKDIESRCVVDELFGYASFQYKSLLDALSNIEQNQDLYKRAVEAFERIMSPTRLYFDDFYVDESYVCELRDKLGRDPFIYDFLEEKSENRIDRLTSAADPRDIVRVKPGVPFKGSARILVFDVDADRCPGSDSTCVERNIEFVASMLKSLEKLGLGAAVSRGYGRVKVSVEEVSITKPPKFKDERIKGITTLDELISKSKEIARKALEMCQPGET